MKLQKRLITILLLVTFIPSLLIIVALGFGISSLQNDLLEKTVEIQNKTEKSTTDVLNSLGEDIIQQKSEDVATEISLYLAAHPDKTVADLQKDSAFQEIAVQPVGETGYTTVMDAKTLINKFHKSSKNVGTDYHSLETSRPEFYAILLAGGESNDSSGYYNWSESDGSSNLKYAYYTCVPRKTADGVTFRVGATTYISEFSKPAEEVKATISEEIISFNDTIKEAIIFYSIFILIIVIVGAIISIFVGYRLSDGIIRPVQKLSDGVRNIRDGNLSYRIGTIDGDELGELGTSIDQMAQALEEQNSILSSNQRKQVDVKTRNSYALQKK